MFRALVINDRLGKVLDKWKEITEYLYILNVLKRDTYFSYRQLLQVLFKKNNKSARGNMFFVQEEVEGLIRKGDVSQVTQVP